MSYSISLSGHSSELTCSFYPSLEFDRPYEIALLYLQSYNYIPNVTVDNCIFEFKQNSQGLIYKIRIPDGAYEISDLENYLRKEMEKIIKEKNVKPLDIFLEQKKELKDYDNIKDEVLVLRLNPVTLNTELISPYYIRFNDERSIGKMLGFKRIMYTRWTWHTSESPAAISKVNILRVSTNISTGSYINGIKSRVIHEFSNRVGVGYKITETVKNLIYMPVFVTSLSQIIVRVTDEDDKLVDFRGELVNVRLHLRPRNDYI